jgi:hypothetical protein
VGCLILCAVAIAASAATAKDVIISPGDDLRAASTRLRPGDRMLLRGGVYHVMGNTIRPMAGGESWGKPITIMAYPGEKPILDGTFVLEGRWEKHKDAIYSFDLQAAGYEKPEDANLRHPTKGYPVSPLYMEILFQDGPPGEGKALVHQLGLSPGSPHNAYDSVHLARMTGLYGEQIAFVDRPGEFFYSPDTHVLYAWLHDGDDPNDHVIRAPFGVRTCLIALGGNPYFIIRGLTLRGSAGAAIWTDQVNHLRIEDCDIGYMGGQLSLGDDCTIRNCHLHHGFYNVAQGTGEGFVFEGNEVDHVGDASTWGYGIIGGETYGLNLSSGDHHVIRSNYFHDDGVGEEAFDGGAIVQETWGRREGQPQERTHHLLLENNVVNDCAYGLLMSGRDTTHHHIIRYNVFRNCTRSALRISGDNRDHTITQNVFAGSRDAAVRFSGGGKSRYLSDPDPYPFFPVRNIVRGNVFIGGEVGFDRGAQRQANVVEANTMLPAMDYTLEQLIGMAQKLGADLSRVPGIR